MKYQALGVELEITGLTRKKAAEVIAGYFRTRSVYEGGIYNKYSIVDEQGRTWQVVRDSSIHPQYKSGRAAPDEYRVEVVTPKCRYEDIETIQEIVRKLRKASAIANDSCGVHIHIDGANHDARSIKNLIKIWNAKEDLIYKALEVDPDREISYCRRMDSGLVQGVEYQRKLNMADLEQLWYNGRNGRHNHYDQSRYRGLNVHSLFYRGTIEVRCFNSTNHAGRLKAYIQLVLAISHQAITQKSASARKSVTDNDKYTMRCWLLRLGLIGDEFKTARLHLLANLKGNAAWRRIA